MANTSVEGADTHIRSIEVEQSRWNGTCDRAERCPPGLPLGPSHTHSLQTRTGSRRTPLCLFRSLVRTPSAHMASIDYEWGVQDCLIN